MPRLGPGVINVLNGEIPFVLMALRRPTVLRTAIREDAIQRNLVLLEERQPPVIQQLGSCDRRFRSYSLANPTLL